MTSHKYQGSFFPCPGSNSRIFRTASFHFGGCPQRIYLARVTKMNEKLWCKYKIVGAHILCIQWEKTAVDTYRAVKKY